MIKILKILVSHIRDFFHKADMAILHCIALLFRPFYHSKQIWLVMERGYEAQDNAWHFFKYLKTTHPEIDARFAIVKSSPDYIANLAEYKSNVVEYGSLRYFIVLFNSSYLISTHLQTYAYFKSIYSWLSHSIFDIKAKKVFLQHGVLHNFPPSFEYPKIDVQLFISGAQNEYRLLTTVFKYPPEIAQYTGLARFDNLFEYQKKRQVLIMPTWRAKYAGYSKKAFEQTDFFVAYKELLTDSDLLNTLNQYGYEILFYNHYEFQKYNQSFEAVCGEKVKMVRFGEKKVQELLKDASLLVTDYSSVYYDFFYMKKPILFFKLNKEEFEASQYGVDYDDPNDFGYVSYSVRATVNSIISLIKNNCLFENRFIEHHTRIFTKYDQNNCKRVFDAIVRL